MDKKMFLTLLYSLGICRAFTFEKLDSKYQISYGNPNSQIKVVEYFSLSCTKCFEFFNEDFQTIRHRYLDRGEISWSFHPDPADLLTLQAMVCLETLPDEEKKRLFLETVLKHIQEKNFKHGCLIMQATMEVLGFPLPNLAEMEFLEKTRAFGDAFLFLKQKDVVKIIPTLEINGELREEYPSKDLLENELRALKEKK